MSDLREIFLQPECCADEHSGRLWCEDDAPVDCEDDDGNEIPWTRYVRADLHDSLAAENAALKAQLAYAASAGDECAIEVESLRSRLAEAETLLDEASPRQECDGCGREFRWHQMFVEEGDRWECAECWDRCEKAERAAMRDRHDDK